MRYTIPNKTGPWKPPTIAGQPERGIPLLVLDVDVGSVSEDQVDELGVPLVGCDGEGRVSGAGDRGCVHVRTLRRVGSALYWHSSEYDWYVI